MNLQNLIINPVFIFSAAIIIFLLVINTFRLALKAEKTVEGAYLYFFSGSVAFFIICLPPYYFDGWINALYVTPSALICFYLFNKGNFNKRKHLFFEEVIKMMGNKKILPVSKILAETDVPEELVHEFIIQMIEYNLINAVYDKEQNSLIRRNDK